MCLDKQMAKRRPHTRKKKSGSWICVCSFFFFSCRLLYIDTPKRSAAFHERSKRKRRAIFYKSPCPAQS